MIWAERRRGQRRGTKRPKRERRNPSQAMTITKKDMAFIRSCPCERCEAYRRRLLICQEHDISGCMECSGHLRRTEVEALWAARFHFRDAFEEFLGSRSRVKRFAATCSCPFCAGWRWRFMGEVSPGRRDRNRQLGQIGEGT